MLHTKNGTDFALLLIGLTSGVDQISLIPIAADRISLG